ncbi:hypothetical protein AaE_001283 [Aphanomyces astaci]|uniref:Tc3 transposase DNA binding domain-containing protein n=1 Tax=Aphanomyces astaci TaxID=112090 RepID=A0A6A5AT94_APHAT|nr:hypothetical protein AaE_001283 [Aphanomyces astaci]
MGQGTILSPMERGMVMALRAHDMPYRAIAKEVGRSIKAIHTFLKNPDTYGTKFSGRKRSSLDGRENRLLVREASKTGLSARSLKTTLNIDASLRTCQRRLQQSSTLSYTKRRHTPALTARHKASRLEYAKRNLEEPPAWADIIWSDEKRFNLDGPDGLQYYWHDLRKEPHTYFSRRNGGGGVMVWGAFSSAGTSQLAFLEGNQNSEDYVDTLGNFLFPFAHEHYGEEFVFMQDGASIHTSKYTKSFLDEENVKVFEHPSLCPDLNPIENLWGILARHVYANGRQYMNVEAYRGHQGCLEWNW